MPPLLCGHQGRSGEHEVLHALLEKNRLCDSFIVNLGILLDSCILKASGQVGSQRHAIE